MSGLIPHSSQDSHNWVMAFYRATGQAHRPMPPVSTGASTAATKAQGQAGDSDRKHGMEEYIGADPITFDHAMLFKKLQSFSLEWRLKDPFSSLVIIEGTPKAHPLIFILTGLVHTWSNVCAR